MKIMEKADLYLLLVFLVGLIYVLFVHEWREVKRNHVIVINNVPDFDWINVNCVPKDICRFWMHRGDVHHYDNMQSLEFSIEENNTRKFYKVSIPSQGTFTIKLKELFQGISPNPIILNCSESSYADYYQTVYPVKCPTPPSKPLD